MAADRYKIRNPGDIYGIAVFSIALYTAMPYIARMHGVLFTQTFERHARDAGLGEDEILVIASWLSENPLAGDLIRGTGGARKVRFAREGKGKSGGYRTIHYYGGDDVPLFVLALIDKGGRSNLSMAERNELAKLLPQIGRAYREGVKARANADRGQG